MTAVLKYFLYFLILVSFLSLLFYNPYVYNSHIYYKSHFIFAIIISIGSCLACLIYLINNKRFSLTILDVNLFIFFLWVLLSRVFTRNTEPYMSESIYCLIVLGNLFLLSRIVLTLKTFFYLISLAFLIQLVVLCVQFAKNFHTANLHLYLTGTIDNSGLVSGFLIIMLPFLFLKFLRRTTISILITVVGFILILTHSRAGLLSFIPLVYLNRTQSQDAVLRSFPRWVWISLIICTLMLLMLFKQPSAYGRLHIWNVTIENSTNSIMTGIGFGKFPTEYQIWHTEYVMKHKNEKQPFNYPDLPNNTFNEPLQIFAELGLIGLFLSFGIIYSALRLISKFPETHKRPFNTSLFGLIIFSLFSYPLHSLPILAVVTFIMSLITTLTNERIFTSSLSFKRYILSIFIFLNLAFLKFTYHKQDALTLWIEFKQSNLLEKADMDFKTAYPFLRENPKFLLDYANYLFRKGKFDMCITIIIECESLSTDINALLLHSKALQKINKFSQAESILKGCFYSHPNLLKPKVELVRHYLLINNFVKANDLCFRIINSNIKTYSPTTRQLQYELSKIYNQLNKKR